MKYKNFQKLDKQYLQLELVNSEHRIFKLRFQKAIGELKDYSTFKNLRKNIARIKTILNNKS